MILLILSLFSQFCLASQVPQIDVISSNNGQLISYRKWKEKNISIIDWDSPLRNQGAIGSCQSFAFLGVVENQVFQSQGVSIDLSERYQLYSNFMEFGALGSNPLNIAEFPNSFAKWGALPETLYPYEVVNKNSSVFEVDSAQGLQSGNEPAILQAIAGRSGVDRSSILQKEEFLGQLPAGDSPIGLPVHATHIDLDRPMRFVRQASTGEEVACFASGSEFSPISLSPSDFATHCLEYRSKDWHVVDQFDTLLPKLTKSVCNDTEALAKLLRTSIEVRRQSLQELLSRLVAKSAAMIAISVPLTLEGKKSVLWDAEQRDVQAGHAIVAVGFLAAEDLNDLSSQKVGLLGSGLFDKMANNLDPSYELPQQNWSNEHLRQSRLESTLGRRVQIEQGIIIFRNSWGDIPGLNGYQAMTFDYYLAHLMMAITSEVAPLVAGHPPGINIDPIAIESMTKETVGAYCPK